MSHPVTADSVTNVVAEGEVFKARDKKARNKFVALKKLLMNDENEGFHITALREIRILQRLKHENVVNLIEVCRTRGTRYNGYRSTFCLVLEFCDHDLAALLYNVNVQITLGQIKNIMQQLLSGLCHIHSNQILHRDLKPANILITTSGVVKLADFGLARELSANKNGQVNKYTNPVVTLWYRPPELLLGERNYGPAVDFWSLGCIMAEMWTRSPILRGHTEQEQLKLISALCGSITPEVWPGVQSLGLFNVINLTTGQKRQVIQLLMGYVNDPHAWDLLDALLILDPTKRCGSYYATDHDFFWSEPLPCEVFTMLEQHTRSMCQRSASVCGQHMQPHHQQQGVAAPAARRVSDTYTGYQDRIY